MTSPHARDNSTSSVWAPWWIYLVVLLGANYLRSWLLPSGHLPVVAAVAIAAGQAAVLFVLITAVWRSIRRTDAQESIR